MLIIYLIIVFRYCCYAKVINGYLEHIYAKSSEKNNLRVLYSILHQSTILNKSLNTPAAVTTGPAP